MGLAVYDLTVCHLHGARSVRDKLTHVGHHDDGDAYAAMQIME
jgi:hypothetical protein